MNRKLSRIRMVDAIKNHPFISGIVLLASLIGAGQTFFGFIDSMSRSWDNYFYPTSYSGEVCNLQRSGCVDPSRFKKVLDHDFLTVVTLDLTLINPPLLSSSSKIQCESRFGEGMYDTNIWYPLSLDDAPEDGCDLEVLISMEALQRATEEGRSGSLSGAGYYKIQGDFTLISVESGPLGFYALQLIKD